MGILFVFLMSLLGVKISTNESVRLEKRLLTFGMDSFDYMLVRMLSLSIFIAIPYAAYFWVFSFMMKDDFSGSVFHMAVVGIIMIMSFSALFTAISTIFKEIVTINLVSMIFIIVIAVLGGTIIPITLLPSFVGQFQFLSMTHWISQGFYLAFFHINEPLFWNTVLVLCLFIVIHLTLAKVFYQRQREVK